MDIEEISSDDKADAEKPSKGNAKGTRRKAVTSNVANTSGTDLCEPEDVVAEVTVKYQGDFILSQLLQWYNGGIGQSPGLPNETLGCIRLPSSKSQRVEQNRRQVSCWVVFLLFVLTSLLSGWTLGSESSRKCQSEN